MNELHMLSKQILDKTEKEGQLKLEQYEKEAAAKIEETRQKLKERQTVKEAQIKKQIDRDYERIVQTLLNNKRNAVLLNKQALLEKVFSKAVEKMAHFDCATFAAFLNDVLKQLDATKTWTIVPGERSVDAFKSKDVLEVTSNYTFLNVKQDVVKGKAGFLLQDAGIDYNFCFDELVKEIKKVFSPQLAALVSKN